MEKQPAPNGLYYRPDSLGVSDAYVVDIANKRHVCWTMKGVDQAGVMTSQDITLLMVHIRKNEGSRNDLLWQVNPDIAGSSDLPSQISKQMLANKGFIGFAKMLYLFSVTEPNPSDDSDD